MENIINLSAHATQSTMIGEWAAAMVAFHAELLPIRKDGEAKQMVKSKDGNQYPVTRRYLSLDGILDAVRPILAKHSLFVTQELTGSGVATTIFHKSGQFRTSIMETSAQWEGSPMTNSIQNAGGSFTYLKRYALAAALAISADEDSDGADHQPQKPVQKMAAQAKQPTANGEQLAEIARMKKIMRDIAPSKDLGVKIMQWLYGVASSKEAEGLTANALMVANNDAITFNHEYNEYMLYCEGKKELPDPEHIEGLIKKSKNSIL